MTKRMHELAAEIVRLQVELDREIHKRRDQLGFRLHAGLVEFASDVTVEHRRLRVGVAQFMAQAQLGTVLSAPLIYSLIVPFVVIDAWVSLYQAICFRVYAIQQVQRADFISLDRRHLAYLNSIEALNCMFCGYGNGVMAYVREVASRTEQYWCPIKHAMRIADPHLRYYEFLEYGDAAGYRSRLDAFREGLRAVAPADGAAPPAS
jgi:hypothetical protein